jgi:hypothetical protein
VAGKKVPDTWYVSVHIPNREKTVHYSRRSQTFANEAEAKLFAAAKAATGMEVSAGTINPVVPKRIIGPSQIRQWLAEKADHRTCANPPCDGAPIDGAGRRGG